MPLKTIQMRSINNKIALTFFLLVFSSVVTKAQEIIKDSAVVATKKYNLIKSKK